ncbi:MAG: hypothetical protein AAGT88_07520, partial [Dethiobacter sp.]
IRPYRTHPKNRQNGHLLFDPIPREHEKYPPEICGIKCFSQLKDFDKKDRDTYIKKLREDGLSTRQIERLTGIKRPIILKA